MIERRNFIAGSIAMPALLASGPALAQDRMRTTDEISRFLYGFFEALEKGDDEGVEACFSDTIRGFSGCAQKFSNPATAVAYLSGIEFGRDMLLPSGPVVLDDYLLVGARWTTIYPGSTMPMKGPSWFFVFQLGHADHPGPLQINRMNVIETGNG